MSTKNPRWLGTADRFAACEMKEFPPGELMALGRVE